MENHFKYGKVVPGENFCNREKELKEKGPTRRQVPWGTISVQCSLRTETEQKNPNIIWEINNENSIIDVKK